MDFTSTEVEVMPPDPEASALAPSPVLLVATSDGALRLFTFAHMTKPTEGIVAPARPYSDTLPLMASEEQVQNCSFIRHLRHPLLNIQDREILRFLGFSRYKKGGGHQ